MAEEKPAAARSCRWWGWGEADRYATLPARATAVLHEELGETRPSPRVELDEVAIPEPRRLPDALEEAVSPAAVLRAHEQRIRRAAGKSYPDLMRVRSGNLGSAPDAVVMPGRADQIHEVLEICAQEGIAVVPFGGGTSVVGGVEPLAGGHGAVIALDLARMRGVEVDPESLTARLGPGLRGPEAENALADHGLSLGHYPQSFEYATIGGFAATRSAGQASCGNGRFDEMVTSVEMIGPNGHLRTLETPHTAAGPSLLEVVLGSEGTLGVITDVGVRLRRAPQATRYEGWFAPSFEAGAEVARELAQSDELPDVLRISDEQETRVSMLMSGLAGLKARALGAYLGLRRVRGGALVIVGWEGEPAAVRRRRELAARRLRAGGAVALGTSPGRAWEHGRFEGPYARDTLLDMGYMVETLETAHSWSGLARLREAVTEALVDALEHGGKPPIVMCHISHSYRDGASLYFTFIAPMRRGGELEQWADAKEAASEAIVATGATITHHHAVGRDHARFMTSEVGETGVAMLAALKRELDPHGLMNPGKLIPS